jgi:hypothetical protein
MIDNEIWFNLQLHQGQHLDLVDNDMGIIAAPKQLHYMENE